MSVVVSQLQLFPHSKSRETPAFSGNRNEPVHRWVPWIAGFSADFVQKTFDLFLGPSQSYTVLDPFAGVGTTLVEAIRRGYDAVGFEINPYAALAARAKLEAANTRPETLDAQIKSFVKYMCGRNGAPPKSKPPTTFKSRVPFFSPEVLKSFLHCLDYSKRIKSGCVRDMFNLALGSVMVSFSNYSYEPSLTTRRGVGRPDVLQAPVSDIVTKKLKEMLEDLKAFQKEMGAAQREYTAVIHQKSFMDALDVLDPASIDLVVTSPPYLNNYHYVRNTRPQIHWLGLYEDQLREKLEDQNIGKFWQTVREKPAITLGFEDREIQSILEDIRGRNGNRGIYGGSGWANYVASYYNDTFRFLQTLRHVLKPRGTAVIVVGNSIIQGVNVRVDRHIAAIGSKVGLQPVHMWLLRTKRVGSSIVDSSVRRAEKTKDYLYETAVILQKR